MWCKKDLGHKDWWDRECTRKKKEVQRCYKKWRRGRIGRRGLHKEGKVNEVTF